MNIISFFFYITAFVDLYGNLISNENFVLDTQTKIIWQDTPINKTLQLSQKDSIKYCDSLKIGKYQNWELPRKEDYLSIINNNHIKSHETMNRVFKYNSNHHYWTRDKTWRNFFRWGYYIYDKSGTFYYDNKSYLKFLRCIHKKDINED